MTITDRIIGLDSSYIKHKESEWSGGAISELFSAFNDGGIECEVGEFLYGLTRLLKPERVLETGSHHGVGTAYIGLALKDNGKGVLDTIEFLQPNFEITDKRIDRLGLRDHVLNRLQDVKDFVPIQGVFPTITPIYDLVLLDTEPQTRFGELLQFFKFVKEGGFIFIHDLHRHMHQIENAEHFFAWPYGRLPNEIVKMVKDDVIRPFHFTTPRGLTGFYKVHSSDYKF